MATTASTGFPYRVRRLGGRLRTRLWPSEVSSPTARVELALTVLLVAAGVFLRLRGMLFGPTAGFWTDEAIWAMRLLERPLSEHLVRPIAFMGLTRLSVAILGYTEIGFRLLPWLAGLATPFVAVLLGRRYLTSPGARLLLVGALSLSSSGIDYSKEFKPYAISVFFHLLLPLLAFRWIESRKRRDLILVGVMAPIGVLFCQDVIFLYPGLFLVLAWEAWQSGGVKRLAVVAGFALLTVSMVLGMYLLFWKRVPGGRAEYWGDKYGVFHRPKQASDSYSAWVWTEYVETVQMPGDRRFFWSKKTMSPRARSELYMLDRLLWFGLHVAGIAQIVARRRWREALLFLSPLLVCGVFNFLGLWPFGAFRTNLFALAGVCAIAALGVDRTTRLESWWRAVLPVALVVLLPLALFERSWNAKKQHVAQPDMHRIVERLVAMAEQHKLPRAPLYLQQHAYNPFMFYTRFHPGLAELRPKIERYFEPTYQASAPEVASAVRALPSGQHVWLMMTRQNGVLPKDLDVVERFRRGHHDVYLVRTE